MPKTSVGSVAVDLELNKKNYDSQLNSTLKNTEKSTSNTFGKVGKWIAGAFTVTAVTAFAKKCVDSASRVQSAFTGLNSIAQGTGNSFEKAQKFIDDYTADGLVSIEETATAYKNLLSRGYDDSQIENVLSRLKDSAAFGRQASYDLGEAVVSATEGLKNENSILVDNAGVTKNVAKMWEEWAKAHGTTTNAMTQAQKIQAEYNGIMEETKFQVGDASAYTQTFSGKIQQLKFNFNQMMVAIGKVVAPIAQLFIPYINAAIQAVTNFFVKIQGLLKIFGLEMPDVVSKASSSISGVGKSAVDTAGDITSTGEAAKKAAKEVNRAFGSMDEINVLNTKSKGSGDSNDDTSGAGTTNLGNTDDLTNSVTETDSVFSKLIKRVKELQSLFMKGFDMTFNVDFDAITKHLDGIKTSLKNIFTDKDVLNAGKNFADSLAFNLGRVVGSIGTIGGNIAETLLGSIDKYLSQNAPRISGFITNMFNIGTQNLDITGNLFTALASISEVFTSDVAKQIGADIIAMFANPIMSVTEFFGKFSTDMYDLFVTPITDNVGKIKTTFENLLPSFETISSTAANAFTYIGDSLVQLYDEHLSPYFESIKTGLSDTFGKFLDVYNQYVAPFVSYVADSIKNLWDNHLKPLWNNFSDFIGNCIDLVKTIWEKWVKPFVDWIIQNIIPKIVPIVKTIYNNVYNVITGIIGFISGLLKTLSGIVQFITGVFSGDWKKAWEGVKKIFGGIWDSLVSLVKIPLNAIIDGINGFIKGLNKIKIPDWVPGVGGKGLKISTIPKLAQGGWVPRNEPQLAVVGDNTKEGEIITPESKIYDQVSKAIKDNGGSANKQEIEIHLYHHYEDGKTIIQKINQTQIDEGQVLLVT